MNLKVHQDIDLSPKLKGDIERDDIFTFFLLFLSR